MTASAKNTVLQLFANAGQAITLSPDTIPLQMISTVLVLPVTKNVQNSAFRAALKHCGYKDVTESLIVESVVT